MRRVGGENAENSRIMLGLLDAVEQDRARSQRLLASELGIALGPSTPTSSGASTKA